MAERRESVRVTATGSDFEREFNKMTRAALETQAALRSIPNDVHVRAHSTGFDKVDRDAQRAYRSSSLLVDSVAMLAPTIAPLSSVAVAGLGGLAAQATVAAGALGTTILAVQGVGTAIKALEKARLDPTTQNVQAAQVALEQMPKDAAKFTRSLYAMRPLLNDFRAAASSGLGGVADGLRALSGRAPQIAAILREFSAAQGDLARLGGESLAGPRWDAFFSMIERTAKPTLMEMGSIVGDLAHSFANLMTGLEPLNREFSQGFAKWADGLDLSSATADYQAFIDYIHETGPQTLATLGSLGSTLLSLVKAAGQISGPTMQIIKTLSDVLGAIAESPAGPALFAAAAGLAAINRALVIQAKLRDSLVATSLFGASKGGATEAAARTAFVGGMSGTRASLAGFGRDLHTSLVPIAATTKQLNEVRAASIRTRSSLMSIGKGGAALAGVGLIASGTAEKIGLSNTAMLGMAGTMVGPWGAAIGAGAGALMDLNASTDHFTEALKRADNALNNGADIGAMSASLAELKKQRDDLVNHKGFADTFNDSLVADGTLYEFNRKIAQTESAIADSKAKEQLDLLAHGFQYTAQGAREAAGGTRGFVNSLSAMQGQLNEFGAHTGYREAMLAARDAAKQNGDAWDKNTPKANANQRAMERLAASAVAYADTLEPLEGKRFLDKARGDFIRAAMAMGRTRDQARQLADDLGLVDRMRVNPKVTVETEAAKGQIRSIKQMLNDLDHDRTIAVKVKLNVQRGLNKRLDYIQSQATGGTIQGPRHPYGDKVLLYAAPGEEVISNSHGQADRWRPLLKAINANAMANGGTVPHYVPSTPSVNVSTSVGGNFTLEGGTLDIPGLGRAILSGARLVVAQSSETQGRARRAGVR